MKCLLALLIGLVRIAIGIPLMVLSVPWIIADIGGCKEAIDNAPFTIFLKYTEFNILG